MNLNKKQPKNGTEELLLSITKKFETLIAQTHRKAKKISEFKLTKSRETCHFNPPIQIERDWMLGLTNLEVYKSFLIKTEENNRIELSKFPGSESGGISYEKVREEVERNLDISDITANDLQGEITGPINIEKYTEQVSKRMEDRGYTEILAAYFRSVFQYSERYLTQNRS